jgi:uncharacterized repeat protein (TIGR01451 family)
MVSASRRPSRLVVVALATALAGGTLAVLPVSVAGAAGPIVTNCLDSGVGSLRQAVATAAAGDTITFSVSCPPATPITLTTGAIAITTNNLTIAGPGASQLAVSGNNANQVFHVDAGVTATISGITVENGAANNGCFSGCGSSGGGIENEGILTLTSVTVTNNSANDGCFDSCGADGGGIENDGTGTLTVTDSTISNNNANAGCFDGCGAAGGGIENIAGGTITVTDSTISGNTTNTSPASNCVDSCTGEGAGIDNAGTATVNSSTVSGNIAANSCDHACGPKGGGIDNESTGTLTLHNSTVADNKANTGCNANCGAFGGGVYNEGTATVTNVTISGNSVSGGCAGGTCGNAGAGFFNAGPASIGATIVANSTGAGDCSVPTAFTDLGYNLDDDGTCGFTPANHDLSNTPAGLDPAGLQNNGGPTQTIELQETSAAVDHVAAALCPPTDQRGSPRIAPCDIGAYDTDGPITFGSQVHDVVEIETSPIYAGDPINITSLQLQLACGGTITFETLQGGTTRFPHQGTNSITTFLDDDGNVTVIVEGQGCNAGTDLIEADLIDAPYLTATTVLKVLPPQVTPAGVTAYPSTEVETGDTTASGISDVYTVFYVETDPVYAEQSVFISSPELENRCHGGWRFEPGGGDPINQASGTTMARGVLDNDGNAEFVFKGAACAPGTSTVIADIAGGTHTTYDTTFTIAAPQVTLGTTVVTTTTTATTKKAKKAAAKAAQKAAKKAARHHQPVTGAPPVDAPGITVAASPNPVVETSGSNGSQITPATLNIVKSDADGGTSGPPAVIGDAECPEGEEYTITVTNSGSTAVNPVLMSDIFSTNPDFSFDIYTSVATGGATGNTSNNAGVFNDISDTLDLPPGSSVVYTVDAALNDAAFENGFFTNTATLTPPAGTTLTPSSNLTATDTDDIFCE